jgi:Tfp pilus assembly protein PilX
MLNWRGLLGNERGVALVLALMMLMTLTGLLLAFLSVSALEPQISNNLADTARARYLAEAGIEVGFARLASNDPAVNSPVSGVFTPAIATATAGAPWVTLINNGTIGGVTTGGSAAEAAFAGTYTVIVRNNFQAADAPLASPAAADSGGVNVDNDRILLMRSTGTFNGATKTIEVVVRRAALPPFPGAVNLPGLQADSFINKTNFDIDGRNYACSSSCDNAANWSLGTGMKYGIATQTGTQSNVSMTYEARVEQAVLPQSPTGSCNAACQQTNSDAKQASIKGKNETDPTGPYTTGVNTIEATSDLNPTIIQQFLDAVASFPGTTILQSTQSCPMQLTGSSTPTSTPTLTNGCSGASGVNTTLDLGTRENPKLVYFRGDTDPSSQFTGLTLNSGIKGAGILVVEDGDLKNLGNFTWDGVVIVTGNYVGSGFMSGSTTNIRGAFVANESQAGEASGYFEFYLHGSATAFSIRNSQQMIDMVQVMRGNMAMTNWREL